MLNLKDKIRDIPDFPEKGILFRDITTLLQDKEAFKMAVDELKKITDEYEFDLIIGPESRGFIVGTPLAYATGKGFVPVRKPGKLPYKTIRFAYDLEYGSDVLEIHMDAIKEGEKVIIVDDLLATGGTLLSTIRLVEQLGGEVAAVLVLIELTDLNGRDKLQKYNVRSLIQY
ncbi:MAG: adenine phosphoribosyltransferase [Clostridiales bacterium]|nr:adenine phosphoribosyltransferase [Clostridiales bacterium]